MNLEEENNLMSDLDYKIFDIIQKVKDTEGYPIKRGVIEIKEELKKRIDSEINKIQKSIDSFTPECGYAMVNQSEKKIAIKVLNHVKKILK